MPGNIADSTEQTDTSGRSADPKTGPYTSAEIRRYGPPTTTHDGRTPSEALAAIQDGEDTFGDGGEHLVSAVGDPTFVRFGVARGDETLLTRIEIDLENETDTQITDTLSVTLDAVNGPEDQPYYIDSLWPTESETEPADGTHDASVTLDAGAQTTLAVTGDGTVSTLGFVDAADWPDGVDPTRHTFACVPPITLRVRVESQNAVDGDAGTIPLTVAKTRAALRGTAYYDVWYADGSLDTIGPLGRVRRRLMADDVGTLFPGGIDALNRAYDADGTGTIDSADSLGDAGPSQYLRSDVDDTLTSHLTHSGGSGGYDLTLPRGDGERLRYESGIGGYGLSITGGHGRVAHHWNTIYDNSSGTWRYVEDGEQAMLIELDRGDIVFRGAPGGVAGDPVPWNTVRYDGEADEFRFEGATTSGVVWRSGGSGGRPSAPQTGQRYFDTGLGKPIWYNGSNWVDAQGTGV